MCRHLKLSLYIAAALALVGGGIAVAASVGQAAPVASLSPVPADEHARTIAAMKPHKRARPVVAVLGHNAGTEVTDYLIPYAVLQHSGAADVLAVAPKAGPMEMKPALRVAAQASLAEFDARYPGGADYVVVAAMHPRNDPAVIAWLKAQEARGAFIVGVCSGVRTLSAAGMLAGRQATRYWYDAEDMAEANPTTRWVKDRRYVVDGRIVTTTGITASMPVSLALVEAIAGRERARAVADDFGVANWDARHDSSAFGFNRRMLAAAVGNKLAVWNRESFGLPATAGVDEVALAFTADAWSRTFRSTALTIADRPGAIRMRHGLTLLPDRVAGDKAVDHVLPAPGAEQPAKALPSALASIRQRYGDATAAFVSVQLEYPWTTRNAAPRLADVPVGHHAK
jgi:putative intracellular protease/amidase